MKKLIQIVIVFLISSGGAFAQIKAGKVDTTSHTSFYSCPKHPEVKNHVPGKCSKCGMNLDLSSKQQMKASQVKKLCLSRTSDGRSSSPRELSKMREEINFITEGTNESGSYKSLYMCHASRGFPQQRWKLF